MERGLERKQTVREKREKKRKKKKLLVLFYIMCSLMFVLALSVMIVWNVFTVEKVIVEGNEHYSAEQIEKFVLNDEYSWNSVYVALKYRFLKTKDIAFVDDLEVSLENPRTLKIRVFEKGIIGYLYISSIGQNAYFDTDGFVVETSKEIIKGIPRVEGLECDKVVLYEKLPIQDENILKNLLGAVKGLRKRNAVPGAIRFNEKSEIALDYGELQVMLGASGNLAKKIQNTAAVLPLNAGKKGVLHMENWTENAADIIFTEVK